MPKKVHTKTAEETVKELLKDNPGLIEIFKNHFKESNNKAVDTPKVSKPANSVVIQSGPLKGKTQTFFDDPKEGKKEGEWDKKFLKDMSISNRRPAVELKSVICGGCGKHEKISEQLYDAENTHLCTKCIGTR